MKLNWNNLDVRCRQEFCWSAGLVEPLASKSWEEIDEWIQGLLADSLGRRSKGRLELCGAAAFTRLGRAGGILPHPLGAHGDEAADGRD
jgi:hypothetical protein